MFDIRKAKNIAQREFPDYPIAEITDIGDRWVFDYDTGNPPIPDAPLVTISKDDGELGYMTIPPLENLEILEKGIKVEM